MKFLLYGAVILAIFAAMKLFPAYQFDLDILLVAAIAVGILLFRRSGASTAGAMDWSFLRSRKSMIGLALTGLSVAILFLLLILKRSVEDSTPPLWLILAILPLFVVGGILVVQEAVRATPYDHIWGKPPWKK